MDGQQQMQEFGRPVSRGGISSATLNFLKLCSIMEPMQELFSFHKVAKIKEPSHLLNQNQDISNGAKRVSEKLPLSKMVTDNATDRWRTSRRSKTKGQETIKKTRG